MIRQICYVTLSIGWLISLSPFALAVSSHPSSVVGRYVTVENKPKHAQIDLLSQTISVRFPETTQTIGEAMTYLLKPSGYSLALTMEQSRFLQDTLKKPLPAIDRDFGPMSLRDGLATLIGPAFMLQQDDLNRTVNFRVKPKYLTLAKLNNAHTKRG